VRRLLTFAGAALVLAGLFSAPAQAQIMAVFMDGRINDATTDAFGCVDGLVACNLWQRYYGDKDPTLINGPSAPTDGYPRYAAKATRYVGDTSTTANYPGINAAATDGCEAWYSVWTGVLNPDVPGFVTYYGAQSTIINLSEPLSSPNTADCAIATAQTGCFGALDTTVAVGSPGAPAGTVAPVAGLSAVPVPTVTASDAAALTVDLAWPAISAGTNVNISDAAQPACPGGSTFANDGTPPPAVLGVRLFLYKTTAAAAPRTLGDLEGAPGTDPIGVLGNPGDGLACSGSGADTNCPSVYLMPCGLATGATCLSGDPDTFDLAAQALQLTQGDVETVLGGPLAAGDVVIFNTKVVFAGALPGSTASGAATNNPSLLSLFSANSTKVSFDALISNVALEVRADRANLVSGTITTVGGPFVAFQVDYAVDGMSFQPVTTIQATGAESYTFTHKLTGRRDGQVTYRVTVEQPDGSFVVMETINVNPGRGQGR
jgi:hypothetical protein